MADTTLYPSDDAYTVAERGNENFGARADFTIGRHSTYKRHGLIRFDLSSIPDGANITLAKLRLYYYDYDHGFTDPSGESSYIRRITESWAEGTVTWNNEPAHTTVNQASFTWLSSYGWIEITVTDIVKAQFAGDNYGFKVMFDPDNVTPYTIPIAAAKEYDGYDPELYIEYTVGVVHTKTFTETLALSDVVQKKPAKVFTESINLSDVYSRTWTLFRTYSETLTLSDVLLKKPSKTFSETLVLGDVLVKKTSKTFTETLNLSDVYSRIWDMYRIYTETLNLSDTLSKKAFKTFLEELNLSDVLQKKLSKTFTESISLSDVFIKKPSKIFTETLSLADVLTKKPSKTFTETLTLSDIYSRKWTIYRTYVETLALREFLIKKPSKTFTETLSLRDLPRTWKINPLETEKLLLKLKHLEDIAGD